MRSQTAKEDGDAGTAADLRQSPGDALRVPRLAALILAVTPLQPIQVMLERMAKRVARSQPQLFARLGDHATRRFLIDPLDLPLALLLAPDPRRLRFSAHRRAALPTYDARITATFSTLLELLDGTLDADAVFFNRKLLVTGNLEAAVSLRNALDDYRGNLVDDALGALGVLSRPASLLLRGSRGPRPRV